METVQDLKRQLSDAKKAAQAEERRKLIADLGNPEDLQRELERVTAELEPLKEDLIRAQAACREVEKRRTDIFDKLQRFENLMTPETPEIVAIKAAFEQLSVAALTLGVADVLPVMAGVVILRSLQNPEFGILLHDVRTTTTRIQIYFTTVPKLRRSAVCACCPTPNTRNMPDGMNEDAKEAWRNARHVEFDTALAAVCKEHGITTLLVRQPRGVNNWPQARQVVTGTEKVSAAQRGVMPYIDWALTEGIDDW